MFRSALICLALALSAAAQAQLLLALLALLLATAAAAQQRQPANVSTLPQSSPQEFDLLDNQGRWMPFGAASGGVFTTFGAGTDVRSYGCVDDGVTDQAACINNAIANAPGCVIIPPTVNGFYVAPGSTINATKCLKGSFYNPDYSTPFPAAFAGQSWIKCGTSATSVCVKMTYDGAYFENLTIATAFPPAVGSIGLQIASGYNSQLRNVNVSGFDQCAYWLSSTAAGNGISSRAIGLNLSWCQTYYVVDDGWPELYITDGRWGSNGQGALTPQPKAMVYITKSANSGAGGGPNGLTMTAVQVNPGGGTTECMVKWGGYVGTGGQTAQFKFIGDHFEFLPPTGSPSKKGVFCTDSTVPNIGQLYVAQSEMGFDGTGGGDTFAFDPATTFSNMSITNSFFGTDSTTLTFLPGGSNATTNLITNSYLGGNFTATGDPSRRLTLANNIMNGMTVTGTWARFASVNDNFANLTDGAARGQISIVNPLAPVWTPQVQFGGVNSTMTWTTLSGARQRTANGGFTASFDIIAGGGTETATGPMTITGLPYTCAGNFSSTPPYSQSGFAAGVGTVTLLLNNSSPAGIRVFKAASTGFATVNNTDVTNALNLYGTVTCGAAS